MKILSGAEIAGYMKANQLHAAQALRSNRVRPKLVIIRDSDNPVIMKYVSLKQNYGTDIGVTVEDWLRTDVAAAIAEANAAPDVHGVIVQLPLAQDLDLDAVLGKLEPRKDVDGLATEILLEAAEGDGVARTSNDGDIDADNGGKAEANRAVFESATATAINWLLAAYDVPMENLKIALVGRGRLIGKPLLRMWKDSGYDVTAFHRGDDLARLKNFDLIVSATGVPRLITNEMIKTGAYVVDAGTASEGGVLVGDVDETVREREDLAGITPMIGGVGPLTVTALFEHVLAAAKNDLNA